MKKVIVNADDFGASTFINQGIWEAQRAGVLKSASLLANGEALQDALDKREKMSLGIHLALVFGKPLAPPEKVDTLIFKAGAFAQGYQEFLPRYLTGGVKLPQIEYEFQAQRQALSSVEIDHLDCHQHLHLLPGIFEIVCRLAEKWKCRFIRIPYENFEIGVRGNDLLPSNMLNLLAWGKKSSLTRKALNTTDHFFGSSFTGALTMEVWRKLLPLIPPGITEIMCHPGYDDARFRQVYRWKSRWEEELQALTNPELLQLAEEHEVKFTNFRELKSMALI